MKQIKLFLPIFILILTFIWKIEISISIAIVLIYLLFLLFNDRGILFRMTRKSFLLFFIFLLLIYPLTGDKSGLFLPFGLNYDYELMFTAIRICLRAILLFALFAQLLSYTKSYQIDKLWKRLGINQYDVLISESEAILPSIKSNLFDLWKKIKSREISIFSPTDVIAVFLSTLLVQKNEFLEINTKEKTNE